MTVIFLSNDYNLLHGNAQVKTAVPNHICSPCVVKLSGGTLNTGLVERTGDSYRLHSYFFSIL